MQVEKQKFLLVKFPYLSISSNRKLENSQPQAMLRLIITRVIITTPRPAGGTLRAFIKVRCLEIQSTKNFIALF